MNYNKEHITLKKKDFSGKETASTIKELLLYPNLKSCNLFHFYINQDDIIDINNLKKLQFIKFDLCYFNMDKLQLSGQIKEISFNLCENLTFQHISSINTRKVRITQWEKANITYDLKDFQHLENLESLEIHNCYIKGIEYLLEKAPRIKMINLDGSKVENRIYLEELKNKITVSNNETYDFANI